MSAREAIWGLLDRFCPPAPGNQPSGAAVEDFREPRAAVQEADAKLLDTDARVYPRVAIYRGGEIVAHGGLVQLTIYLSRMQRVCYRPFRGERYIVSFYWEDGAHAAVAFDSAAEMNDLLHGVAARLLGWPEPVRV